MLQKINPSSEKIFIKKFYPKEKVYAIWLSQLDKMENSTIYSNVEDRSEALENSLDIVFKLFPIIDSISLNLFSGKSGRKYLKKLGYTPKESQIIYDIFRNGVLHTLSPYTLKYNDGVIICGISSSCGSSGFTTHFPGYHDSKDAKFDKPPDKAFTYAKLKNGLYAAHLSLSVLVAHIRYDLLKRKEEDTRETVEIVIGKTLDQPIPSTVVS